MSSSLMISESSSRGFLMSPRVYLLCIRIMVPRFSCSVRGFAGYWSGITLYLSIVFSCLVMWVVAHYSVAGLVFVGNSPFSFLSGRVVFLFVWSGVICCWEIQHYWRERDELCSWHRV